eukprot:998647-Rhodomonas_salina.1
MEGHEDQVMAVAFSSDGKMLYSADSKGFISWDGTSWKAIAKGGRARNKLDGLTSDRGAAIQRMFCLQNGLLVTAELTERSGGCFAVRLWDPTQGFEQVAEYTEEIDGLGAAYRLAILPSTQDIFLMTPNRVLSLQLIAEKTPFGRAPQGSGRSVARGRHNMTVAVKWEFAFRSADSDALVDVSTTAAGDVLALSASGRLVTIEGLGGKELRRQDMDGITEREPCSALHA